MDTSEFSFIHEPIEAIFHEPPMFSKTPPCPDAIIWRGEFFPVLEMLESWQDFKRRGKYARNMRAEHLEVASRRGSWGVGRYHFRVRVPDNRIFQIYYDRAPENAGDRAGHWFMFGERRGEIF
jgi:hypothetical protein